jgi:hypothetical protein
MTSSTKSGRTTRCSASPPGRASALRPRRTRPAAPSGLM